MKTRVHTLIACTLVLLSCSSPGGDVDTVGQTPADTADEGRLETVGEVSVDLVEGPPPGPVVFAVTSDPHIFAGIEHTISQRLVDCISAVAGLTPAPEFLAITGDLTDSIFEDNGVSPALPLDSFNQIISNGELPVHPVAGNHDYYAQNYPQFLLTSDREGVNATMKEVLGIDPWYSVTVNGVKFILLNSMQGDLWDISMGLSGSLGTEQLEWLDGELDSGAPAVLFLHHPPALNEESADAVTLEDVVAIHQETVLAVFAGHLHLWSKAEFGGVPLYLTAANQDGVVYHHVKADPSTMSVTILNEEDIDYGEFSISSCVPEEETALDDLTPFEGTIQHLLLSDAVAEPAGFGDYIEEGIKMLPMVLQFGGPDPSGLALPALFTIGEYVGNSVGSIPPYVAAAADAPCLLLDLLVTNPCFITQPVDFTMDLAKAFGLPLKPGWEMRIRMTEFQLEGVLAQESSPKLLKGTLRMKTDFNLTLEDLRHIVVSEYCAGAITACQPAEGEYPACPEPVTTAFFPEIPAKCDVNIFGFGVRMLLALVESVPGGIGSATAVFESWIPEVSEQPKAGAVSPSLFQDNCAWP